MQRKTFLLILIVVLLLTAGGVALSNTGSGLELAWWTVDGGGGLSEGGTYLLHGTTGQFDSGDLQGGTYALAGGFWQPLESDPYPEKVMLPVVIH